MTGLLKILVIVILLSTLIFVLYRLVKNNQEDSRGESEDSGDVHNKVVNVTFTGGILGLFLDSPKAKLARIVKRENGRGMRVVQVIPAESGNIFLAILRLVILVLTLFLYTPVNGYYVIFEKKNDSVSL